MPLLLSGRSLAKPCSLSNRASPHSYASCRSRSPASHSQRHRSRDRSSLSRRPSPASMTRIGDLPGTCLCRPGAVLLRTHRSNHPGAIVRPFAPGGCPPISAAVTLPLGHLHLDLAGDRIPVFAVHAPGLLTEIINDVCTRRTNVFSGFVTFLLFLNRMKTWMLTRFRQQTIPSYQRRQSRNFLTIYSVLQPFPIMLTLIQLWTRWTLSWCLTIRMRLKPRRHVMEMN